MGSIENLIQKRIQTFTSSLVQSLHKEKELDELDKQGKTWSVIQMDGSLVRRGEKELPYPTRLDEERFLIQS